MKAIKDLDLFGAERFLKPTKSKVNERFELLEYFCNKLNPTRIRDGYKEFTPKTLNYVIGRGVTNRDLYFVKSDCDKAEIRGVPYFKSFFHLINQYNGKKTLPRS